MRIRARDGQSLRKVAVRLAMATNTGYDYYIGISVAELLEVTEAVVEYGREQKDRIRNSNADPRRSSRILR